ncbi:MAG: 50S ribosomal protein L33 [Patescibacteria group bacterium]
MPQDNIAKMACTVCKRTNYHTTRNKRIKARLELNKPCPNCHKHTLHKETK